MFFRLVSLLMFFFLRHRFFFHLFLLLLLLGSFRFINSKERKIKLERESERVRQRIVYEVRVFAIGKCQPAILRSTVVVRRDHVVQCRRHLRA